MKHLRLFENKWNHSSLEIFSKEKDELYKAIKEFIVETRIVDEAPYEITDVYLEKIDMDDEGVTESIIVSCLWETERKYTYAVDSVLIANPDDFFLYFDNKEAYRNSKKFNV